MNAVHAQTMKWTYKLKDLSVGQTAAKDVDEDGNLELIFGTSTNDSNVYCLNSEDGTLKWKYPRSGWFLGCNDVGPLIFDPFGNGNYKVVLPCTCTDTTFCLNADNGSVLWKTTTGTGISATTPSAADIDGDGKPEVMLGTDAGDVQCLNGQTGMIKWTLPINVFNIGSGPAIIRNSPELDFAIATFNYVRDSNRIACYRASDHSLKWQYFTHNLVGLGPAVGDLFRDGQKEVVIGDEDGYLYCFRSSDGILLWVDSVSKMSGSRIDAPVTLADIDNDGYLDIIYMDAFAVHAINRHDSAIWTYTVPPGDHTNFYGAAVADVNNDNYVDVTFCTKKGKLISLDGHTGAVIRSFDLFHYATTVLGDTSSIFEVYNAPIIADFDQDGALDVFIIGGKGDDGLSSTTTDYGYAFCLSWGAGNGPAWTMFLHDEYRTACLCDTNGLPLPTGTNIVTGYKQDPVIYPNPSTGSFTLTLPQTNEKKSITIYDFFGRIITTRTVTTNETQQFNISNIPGVYIAEVVCGDYVFRERVVVW